MSESTRYRVRQTAGAVGLAVAVGALFALPAVALAALLGRLLAV